MSEAALSRATDLPAVWQDLRFEGAVKPAQMIAKSLWRHIVRHNNSLPDLHQGGAGNPFRSGAGHVLLSENFFQLFTKIIGMKNMCQVMNLALMLQKALSGARLHIDHTKDFSIAGNLAICVGLFPSPHVNRYSRLFCTLQRLFCKNATKMQNIMRT